LEFNKNVLYMNSENEVERIIGFIRNNVVERKKEGLVIGLSGGIDSALVSALCVRALGKEKVFGLVLPEKESNPVSRDYAEIHAKALGIRYEVNEITRELEAFGAYEKRDSIIMDLYPEYLPDKHRIKITLPGNILEKDGLNFFSLTIDDGKKVLFFERLKKHQINGIFAATDLKQRTRMMHLYYNAERMNRLVCGTTNRPETLQGYFVKCGDGGVDMEPIAHLYKTQVYQLSRHLGIPPEIIDRQPSPDTFNSQVGDEEFFFRMPYDKVDMFLYAWEHGIDMEEICNVMDLSKSQVERVLRDLTSKFRSTKHLRELPPSLLACR